MQGGTCQTQVLQIIQAAVEVCLKNPAGVVILISTGYKNPFICIGVGLSEL